MSFICNVTSIRCRNMTLTRTRCDDHSGRYISVLSLCLLIASYLPLIQSEVQVDKTQVTREKGQVVVRLNTYICSPDRHFTDFVPMSEKHVRIYF